MTLQEKIDVASNLKQINALRDAVVKVMNANILKQWQDKYWALKLCPICGKAK